MSKNNNEGIIEQVGFSGLTNDDEQEQELTFANIYKNYTPEEKKNFILKEQEKHTSIEEMASMVGSNASSIKSVMNRQGYRVENGIFKPKNFKEENRVQGSLDLKEVGENFKPSKKNSKKYVQINAEMLDILFEAMDWYSEHKNDKKFRPKQTKKMKELWIQDDYSDEEFVQVKAKVPQSVAEEFERFCANSMHDSDDIFTQALIYFMEEYKYLK